MVRNTNIIQLYRLGELILVHRSDRKDGKQDQEDDRDDFVLLIKTPAAPLSCVSLPNPSPNPSCRPRIAKSATVKQTPTAGTLRTKSRERPVSLDMCVKISWIFKRGGKHLYIRKHLMRGEEEGGGNHYHDHASTPLWGRHRMGCVPLTSACYLLLWNFTAAN